MPILFTHFLDVFFAFLLKYAGVRKRRFTYRGSDGHFEVGYWTNRGDFYTRHTVRTEQEAKDLTQDLNVLDV